MIKNRYDTYFLPNNEVLQYIRNKCNVLVLDLGNVISLPKEITLRCIKTKQWCIWYKEFVSFDQKHSSFDPNNFDRYL